MTRRARHAWALAGIGAWTLVLTPACPSAAVPQPGPVDLSALKFAPSLPTGAVADAALPPAEPDLPLRSSARAGQKMLELAEEIAVEQQREGQFSPGLRSYLVSLAKLYQELGDHVAAIATLERTRQIVRVTNGLSSLDQAEIALLEIASLEAIGKRDLAARERTSLVELARRHRPICASARSTPPSPTLAWRPSSDGSRTRRSGRSSSARAVPRVSATA